MMDVDLWSEGFEGMRRHRRFLAAERVRLLAIADQIDAGLASLQSDIRREIETHRRLLDLIEADRYFDGTLGIEAAG